MAKNGNGHVDDDNMDCVQNIDCLFAFRLNRTCLLVELQPAPPADCGRSLLVERRKEKGEREAERGRKLKREL